jgi:hypothetical protein
MAGGGAMLLVGAFFVHKITQKAKEHDDQHKNTRGLVLIFGIQVASFTYSS